MENTENKTEKTQSVEVAKTETQQKDHFKFIDTAFEETNKAHTVVDGLLNALGDYKGPVILAAILSYGLMMAGYEFLSQMVGMLIAVIVVLKFVLSRFDGAVRNKANQAVDLGIHKIQEIKKKKEEKKANQETK